MNTAFVACIEKIKKQIDRGEYENEADIEGIVQQILQQLGWDIFSPKIVNRQYDGLRDNSRVDFALLGSMGKPLVFIEVKQLDCLNNVAIEQLFQYGSKGRVSLLILTDGRQWFFYNRPGDGDDSDRQFLKLDIKEDPPEHLEEQFGIFLSKKSVDSGQALKDARTEQVAQKAKKKIESHLIAALQNLLANAHEGLRDLLRGESGMLNLAPPDKMQKSMQRLSKWLSEQGLSSPSSGAKQPGQKIVGYVLDGEEHSLKAANTTLKEILDDLQARDSGFLERFKRETDTEKRHLVDPKRERLYISTPDLKPDSKQLRNGWWLIQGVNTDDVVKHVQTACRVANIGYGSQLKILWG